MTSAVIIDKVSRGNTFTSRDGKQRVWYEIIIRIPYTTKNNTLNYDYILTDYIADDDAATDAELTGLVGREVQANFYFTVTDWENPKTHETKRFQHCRLHRIFTAQ